MISRYALEGFQNYQYLHDWVGMFSPTEGGRVPATMHHIELLGTGEVQMILESFAPCPQTPPYHPTARSSGGDDEEVMAYKKVCRQLRQQHDGHFLSMVSSLVLAILTGRTDLCVSGVFGAGKTRAAAALIAGLMIIDPFLNLMVMTKENTAAKAFADQYLKGHSFHLGIV